MFTKLRTLHITFYVKVVIFPGINSQNLNSELLRFYKIMGNILQVSELLKIFHDHEQDQLSSSKK